MTKFVLTFFVFFMASAASATDEMPIIDMSQMVSEEAPSSGAVIRWQGQYSYKKFESGDEAEASFSMNSNGKLNPYMNAHLDVELSAIDGDSSRLQNTIHQAFLDNSIGRYNFNIGIQKIDWGQMDFQSPANLLAPLDLSRGISGDVDSQVRGTAALQFKMTFDGFFVEALFRPFHTAHLFPGQGSPWDRASAAISQMPGAGVQNQDRQYGSQGLRLGLNLGTLGIRVMSYSGYESFKINDSDNVETSPTELSYNALAMDLGLGPVVFKGEFAAGTRNVYYLNSLFQIQEELPKFQNASIALDYGVDSLNFMLELASSKTDSDNKSLLPAQGDRGTISTQSSIKLNNDDLVISFITQHALEKGEQMLILKGSNQFRDWLSVELGYVDFAGEEETLLGQYKKSSHFYSQLQFDL